MTADCSEKFDSSGLHKMNQSGPDQLVIVITNAASPAAQQYASHFVTIGAKLLLNYPPNSSSTHTLSSKQEAENHDKRYIIETHLDTTDADNIIAKTLRSYGAVHVLVHDISCRSPSPTYDLISSSTWEFMRTRVLDGAFKVPHPETMIRVLLMYSVF